MTGTRTIALLQRPLESPFAQRGADTISTGRFLGQVHALARRLPKADHVFNLVQDRYVFTVAFAAALVTGRCTLLPPNGQPEVQARLARRFPSVAVLHDGADTAPGLASLAIGTLEDDPCRDIPSREAASRVMIAFTSGSSGEAKPIAKSLGMLRGAADRFERHLVPPGSHVVATVPAQHMYGLELASLQAFWSPVLITPNKPLFPGAVREALASVTGPRVLVTTPLHLRALVAGGLEFPSLERILCATAPLDAELAGEAEARFGAMVLDVYGCSEVGCMASRRAARETHLEPFDGLTFQPDKDGATVVHGPYLDEPVALADRLEFTPEGRFRLAGRHGDLINVAGKRGSLAEITRHLLAVPGVEDAAAFAPPGDAESERPAAVYAGTATAATIRAHLRRELDPAFVPRPLIRLDRLPRTESSKLPRAVLLDIYHQRRSHR